MIIFIKLQYKKQKTDRLQRKVKCVVSELCVFENKTMVATLYNICFLF